MKENAILDLSFKFALAIITFCEELENRRKFVVAGQLLKSGTSIGANIREAQSPENNADFIHKMKVAAKEAAETEYWLLLCQHSENYPDCEHLLKGLLPIQKLLSAILSTSKNKYRIGKSTH